MKSESLLEDVLVAAALTAAAVPIATVFGIAAVPSMVFAFTAATLAFVFVILLFQRRKVRTGRVTMTLAVLIALIVGSWFLGPKGYCVLAGLLIWFVRSAFSYSSFVMAGVDFLLTLFGLSAAWYVYGSTGSFLFAVWCFFLTQGFARWIPAQIPLAAEKTSPKVANDRFERAYESAEAAIRRVIQAA